MQKLDIVVCYLLVSYSFPNARDIKSLRKNQSVASVATTIHVIVKLQI